MTRGPHPRSSQPKRCPGCGLLKPSEAYATGVRMTDGLQCRCRACQKDARTPERVLAKRLQRYGIGVGQYRELVLAQEGRCALCAQPLGARHEVDHCHSTGRVRGILCTGCNTGLGRFGDDPDRLREAARYLERI